MARYRVNVTMVYLYAKDIEVEADSEEAAKLAAKQSDAFDEPDLSETSNGWIFQDNWVGSDWEYEVIASDTDQAQVLMG